MSSNISKQTFSLRTRQPEQTISGLYLSDEDLLTPDDMTTKTRRDTIDNCQIKKRTCVNCTCGRAAIDVATSRTMSIAAIKITLINGDDIPVTGCGSCSKGDAFRCSNCQFLGEPIWSEGIDGKVKLNL